MSDRLLIVFVIAWTVMMCVMFICVAVTDSAHPQSTTQPAKGGGK